MATNEEASSSRQVHPLTGSPDDVFRGMFPFLKATKVHIRPSCLAVCSLDSVGGGQAAEVALQFSPAYGSVWIKGTFFKQEPRSWCLLLLDEQAIYEGNLSLGCT